MLVAIAATISLSALLRPLLWPESTVANAGDRVVHPLDAPNAADALIPAVHSAAERTPADAGEPLEARVKRNVAPNRERPGQDHVPPRDA
ncbi:MAG: hypothetical protein IPN34_00020 [Planctomycetes bacterium]|nr:hypothetical protein [Planctomycetota bacterium]